MRELLYQKIAEKIKADIKNGKSVSGNRLPGVRELAAEWETSSNTVLKALSLLENEGFVRKNQGQGIFVESVEHWQVRGDTEIELMVYDMSTPFNMMLVRNIEKAAGDYCCRLTIKTFNKEELFPENIQAAGRIIIPKIAPAVFIADKKPSLPTICIGEFNPPDSFSCSYAVADTYAGFYKAARLLLNDGRERIAYIGASSELEEEAGWNACRDALTGRMNGFRQEYAVSAGGWDAELGRSAMENILLGGEYPDGLICCNDTLAAGAYKACRAVGLSIPDDIAIIGAGDQDIAPLLEPPLTSLRYPAATIGLTAVNFIKSISSGKISIKEMMRARHDMELITRGSSSASGGIPSVSGEEDGTVWL